MHSRSVRCPAVDASSLSASGGVAICVKCSASSPRQCFRGVWHWDGGVLEWLSSFLCCDGEQLSWRALRRFSEFRGASSSSPARGNSGEEVKARSMCSPGGLLVLTVRRLRFPASVDFVGGIVYCIYFIFHSYTMYCCLITPYVFSCLFIG